MRKFPLALFVMLITFSMACRKDAKESENVKLAIDAQRSFDNDRVQVLIDNTIQINEHLKTHNVRGVCALNGQTQLSLAKSSHQIEVIISDTIRKSETFELNKDLYIGINFDRVEKKISFVYSAVPFDYD